VLSKLLKMTDHEGSTCLHEAGVKGQLRTLREALEMEAAVGRSAATRGRTWLLHMLYSPVYF
jgi:hypothetical protein